MTTMTTTITMSNVNEKSADKNDDDGHEDCGGQEPIPHYGLPTRTWDGGVGNIVTSSPMRSRVRFPVGK